MNFNKELFTENLQGIAVSGRQIELLDSFGALLTEKNKSVNLTSITDPDGIAVKHFADSISLLKADIPQGAKVLDLGCGAGFPGIPLLIMRPDIKLTLLDSTGKKLDFVSEALDALGLEAEVLHGRAEELGQNPDYREKYDIVVSRAVARLNTLCELALPLVKTGGTFIPMKGASAAEEAKAAYTAIKTLGGNLEKSIDFTLTDGSRSLLIIKKLSPTPPKYPRHGSQISKKPL